MNLYLLSQKENNDYDTYDSAVVCAPDEETARDINPRNGEPMDWESGLENSWCAKRESVKVALLGIADDSVKPGIVCASYNAG